MTHPILKQSKVADYDWTGQTPPPRPGGSRRRRNRQRKAQRIYDQMTPLIAMTPHMRVVSAEAGEFIETGDLVTIDKDNKLYRWRPNDESPHGVAR